MRSTVQIEPWLRAPLINIVCYFKPVVSAMAFWQANPAFIKQPGFCKHGLYDRLAQQNTVL